MVVSTLGPGQVQAVDCCVKYKSLRSLMFFFFPLFFFFLLFIIIFIAVIISFFFYFLLYRWVNNIY